MQYTILKAIQFAIIYINDTTFRLLQANGGKKVYIHMNDEPTTVDLNCIAEPVMICVVIM